MFDSILDDWVLGVKNSFMAITIKWNIINRLSSFLNRILYHAQSYVQLEPWHKLIRLNQYTWSVDSHFCCHLQPQSILVSVYYIMPSSSAIIHLVTTEAFNTCFWIISAPSHFQYLATLVFSSFQQWVSANF